MRLLLIRHGQTPSNVDGLLDTAAPGPGLTELGHRQAEELPDALEGHDIASLWASTLVRTELTAAPLARQRGLPVTVLDGIHEIAAGDLELRHDHEAYRTYLQTAFAWATGDLGVRMPGGENGTEFFARFDRSIARVEAETTGTAVVVSHGAAIRVWVAGRSLTLPPAYAGEHDLRNTGVVELEGSMQAGWRLLRWQGTPIGGSELADPSAEDPTGDTLSEA